MRNISIYIKRFFRENTSLLIISCTIFNIFIFILVAGKVFGKDDFLEWASCTGPLGDTIGGILSPIVGAISIYFIYKTFKAQGEQLEDQRKANSLESNAFYFKEGKLLIDEALDLFDNLRYWDTGSGEGIDSFKQFMQITSRQSIDYIKCKEFVDKVGIALNVSVLAIEIGENIKDDLLTRLYYRQFSQLLSEYLEQVASTANFLSSEVEKSLREKFNNRARHFVLLYKDLDKKINLMTKVFIVSQLPNDYNVNILNSLNQLPDEEKGFFENVNFSEKWTFIKI